jgi:uncharacterized membrane-anchored protein YhcB (DUF1043 family)
MSDAETKHVVELQTQLSDKLTELGFAGDPLARELVHHLAEIAALCRTLEQQSLPLFNSLSAAHRHSFADLVTQIKSDLDAIQDSITDAQPALRALLRHLLDDQPPPE